MSSANLDLLNIMKTLRSIQILNYLKDRKYCSLKELEQQFDVSPATIHRDVSELARDNYIQKVHGGVAFGQELASPNSEEKIISAFSARVGINVEKKIQIANEAVKFIQADDVVFLDSSTTSLYLAKKIQSADFSRLTIVTNSVLIIQEFHLFPSNYYLISLGGNFSYQLNSFLGKTAIENLRRLKIDKAFISGVGITPEGIFTYHEQHAEFLKEVLEASEKKGLLLDSSKFGRAGVFKICPLSDMNCMFSDEMPPKHISGNIMVHCPCPD